MGAINNLSSQSKSKHWISRHFAYACFPAHLGGCNVSRALHQLQVFLSSLLEDIFLRLPLVSGDMSSRAFYQLHAFPCLLRSYMA